MKHLKIFVGFIQILSVSDSVFKTPWPDEFLSFLVLTEAENVYFDFYLCRGLDVCSIEISFFHSIPHSKIMKPRIMVVWRLLWLGQCKNNS